MRLLVSVRSVAEAVTAIAGGADIVDAKEPSRGPLGPVDGRLLPEIVGVTPPGIPFSVALGDVGDAEQAAAAVAGVPLLPVGPVPLYLKLGFAHVGPEVLDAIIAAAAGAARARNDGSALVAAAYADHQTVGGPSPERVALAAARCGAAGVLVDTGIKDGHTLLDWMPRPRLDAWVEAARAAGLLTAVAGSLRGAALAQAAGCGADVLGVRGAGCDGGREGVLLRERIRAVKAALSEGRTSPRESPEPARPRQGP